MVNIWKRNKFFLLAIGLVIALVLYSFYTFYQDYFGYVPGYYKMKEICYEQKDLDNEICKQFRNMEDVERSLEIHDPVARFKSFDAITLTCTIVEHTAYNLLQYFSPLIIAIAVIGTLHSEFSSGMFENYLLRMNYKKYLRKTYKVAIKGALIIPFSLILIFILASIFSGFNFSLENVDTSLAVYDTWKYDHFLLYGIIICLIQFFISLFYANIGLLCLKKCKNKLVAIIMSFVAFLLAHLFIYLVLYAVIINKILGFKELTEYFSITGYWFFENSSDSYIALIISVLLMLFSLVILIRTYRNKEKVIECYEEQVS